MPGKLSAREEKAWARAVKHVEDSTKKKKKSFSGQDWGLVNKIFESVKKKYKGKTIPVAASFFNNVVNAYTVVALDDKSAARMDAMKLAGPAFTEFVTRLKSSLQKRGLAAERDDLIAIIKLMSDVSIK